MAESFTGCNGHYSTLFGLVYTIHKASHTLGVSATCTARIYTYTQHVTKYTAIWNGLCIDVSYLRTTCAICLPDPAQMATVCTALSGSVPLPTASLTRLKLR